MRPLHPYTVQTTAGPQRVMATTPADAITTAIELAGPGACVVAVFRDDQW